MQIDREQRIRKAEELFMQGFNCSQSVVAAFADIYGYTEEQALRMSAGFGGGIGRLRLSCGAFNALALLAGLDCGSVTPGDREGKSYNYKVVQELAARFKEEHGSLICAPTKPQSAPQNTTSSALASTRLSPRHASTATT